MTVRRFRPRDQAGRPPAAVRASSATSLAAPRAARPSATGNALSILGSKLLSLLILAGAVSLLGNLTTSPDFEIARVAVEGNQLLTAPELELQAAATGINIFVLREDEIRERLGALVPVERVDLALVVPDSLIIRVREREPAVIWMAGATPFLVDREGLVLGSRSAVRPLNVIRDSTNEPLEPGSRVNAAAVRSVVELDGLLGQTFGEQRRQFEYTSESGLNVVQSSGPRLILGNGDQLEWKIAAVQTIVRHLEATHRSAELIDVRFGDRPFFR